MAYAPSVSMYDSPPPADSVADPSAFRPGDARDVPGGPASPAPYWNGNRLVDPRVTDGDRVMSVIMHLWWVAFFLGLGPFAIGIPIIMWAVRQSGSGFVDDHGREVINAQINLAVLCVVPLFWPILPVWGGVAIVNSIRAAVAASRREHFRYPAIFRPLG